MTQKPGRIPAKMGVARLSSSQWTLANTSKGYYGKQVPSQTSGRGGHPPLTSIIQMFEKSKWYSFTWSERYATTISET